MIVTVIDSGSHRSGFGTPAGSLVPLDREPGVEQGRLASARATDGAFAFELGHAGLERDEIADADFAELTRAAYDPADPTVLVLRADAEVEVPGEAPPGRVWVLRALLGGAEVYARRLDGSRRRVSVRDIALPAAGATFPADLVFRLDTEPA